MKQTAEIPLHTWLRSNGIQGALFDLDDTLIKTSEVFFAAIQEVIQLYAQAMPELSIDTITEIFSDSNIAMYQQYSVNPKRWEHVVPEFESRIKLKESRAEQALEILSLIYKRQIEYETDARKLLEVLKEAKLLLGLVTHANIEWTLFKLANLGLDSFFDHVEIVDENKLHKGKEDWEQAARQIKVPKSQILGVGDNIIGDIQAATQAGLGQVVWIDKKNGWQHYRQGELPSGIVVVTRVGELLTIGTE